MRRALAGDDQDLVHIVVQYLAELIQIKLGERAGDGLRDAVGQSVGMAEALALHYLEGRNDMCFCRIIIKPQEYNVMINTFRRCKIFQYLPQA